MSRLNLDKPMPLSPRLSIYRWRAPMLASIAHRGSGMLLLVFLLFIICLFDAVNGSPEQFLLLQQWMQSTIGHLFLWCAGAALIYHLCNGVRFMLLDIGVGESRQQMRLNANINLIIGVLSLLFMMVLL